MPDGRPVPVPHPALSFALGNPGIFYYLAAARGFVQQDQHKRELDEARAGIELAAMPSEERTAILTLAAEWRAERGDTQ